MADVSAKDQSQERIVNLFALIFSLIFMPFVSDQPVYVFVIFEFKIIIDNRNFSLYLLLLD